MRSLTWLLGLSSFASAASLDLVSRQSAACNNAVSLCSKNYDQVVHLGAHNSPFLRDATTGFSTSGNQYYDSIVQLNAGVRLLTGQVHKTNNEWHLCHSSCDLLDAGRLSTWLSRIREWMDDNPNEVVTVLLVNSDNAKRAELDAEFQKSEITKYKYTPPSEVAPESWPTLQSLINAKTRLITFIASVPSGDAAEPAYLMNEFNFIFENNFENYKPEDFSCEPSRPSSLTIESALSSHRMPFLNHFLYDKISSGIVDIEAPNVDNITTTNNPSTSLAGALGSAAERCKTAYGNRPPTFLLVDFFDEGPAIDTVDRMNGVVSATGRRTLPARDMQSDQNERSFAGIKALVKQVQAGETPSMGAWIWGAGQWTLGGINLHGGNLIGF